MHTHPSLTNGREPDLALLLRYDDGSALLVLIEAKYMSGMSDYHRDAPESEDALTGDQILDQVRGMEKMSRPELLEWFEDDGVSASETAELRKTHLLVTAHPALPADVYKRSVRKRRRPWPPCYWLSWLSLADCLEPYRAALSGGQGALVDDLYRLLHRKKLVRFRNGFGFAPWASDVDSSSFWQQKWWSSMAWRRASGAARFWQQGWWQRGPWRAGDVRASFWRE